MLLYFAYGSNLSREQMRRRCPGSSLVGPALLRGHRLGFGGHANRWNGAVATVHATPDACVPGLVYRLTDDDLARLDGFESYPYVYTRGEVNVEPLPDLRKPGVTDEHRADPATAWTYWFALPRPIRAPSDVYAGIIRTAYREWAFDEDGLRRALAHSGYPGFAP